MTTGSRSSRRAYTLPARRRFLRGYAWLLALVVAFVVMVVTLPSKAGAQSSQPKALPKGVAVCKARAKQVAGDPYSPACLTYKGNNGGATSPGVTGKEITVAMRIPTDNISDLQSLIAQFSGGPKLSETYAQDVATMQGLVDYFNKHFQMYGRKLKLVPYNGRGAVLGEFLGGGQENANADAIKVADELKAFADISALSTPYADALSRRKVVNIGAPYIPSTWFASRAPYAWSTTPDCSFLTQAFTEYAIKRLVKRKAIYAGDALKDKTRKIGIVAPDDPAYDPCVSKTAKLLKKAGAAPTVVHYTLDVAKFGSAADALVPKLKAAGVTTVLLASDPILPITLTNKAAAQDYTPEWLILGIYLSDTDIIGQLYNQAEWGHAFGITSLSTLPNVKTTEGYKAYRTVRKGEPSLQVPAFYFRLYELVLGIQGAGPDLTPKTFEQGLRSYAGGDGEAGKWAFPAGTYTAVRDVREVFWNPDGTSPYNGRPGTYVKAAGPWALGQVPKGQPQR